MDGSRRYDTDLSGAAWALVAPLPPPARPGGRPCTTDLRAVVDAILYLLRAGCQWRLLPRDFPPWSTVHHHFRLFTTVITGEIMAHDQPIVRSWRRTSRTASVRPALAARPDGGPPR